MLATFTPEPSERTIASLVATCSKSCRDCKTPSSIEEPDESFAAKSPYVKGVSALDDPDPAVARADHPDAIDP